MGFSRQEYGSELPFSSPGDLPDSGIKLRTPTLKAESLPSEPPGKPQLMHRNIVKDEQSTSEESLGKQVSSWLTGKHVYTKKYMCTCICMCVCVCVCVCIMGIHLSSVQSLKHVWLFATPGTAACQASLFITNSQNLFKLMSIESVMPFNNLILCRPLLLLPSVFLSIRVFSSESVLHIRWPKHWSYSFSISPSNEYSGLVSFRMDWSDLLTVQGTPKSLFEHHSSKAWILWHSTSFIVQPSHKCMTTGKKHSFD